MGVANPSEDLLIEGRIPEGTVHPDILPLLHGRRLGHLKPLRWDKVGDGDGDEINDDISNRCLNKANYNQTTLERGTWNKHNVQLLMMVDQKTLQKMDI